MDLFKLLGRIVVEHEEAIDAINDVTKEAKKAGDALGQMDDGSVNLSNRGFTVLKGAAANLVADGLRRVGNAVGDFIRDGFSYSKQIEQYATSFETMTGSAEKAAEMTQRLQEIGAATPFELPQLANTTQLLMNYGFTADEAISKMMMLGDISQGNADKMTRIATAYGQMSSAGKVHLEDIKQMIEAGFNPLQEISQTTGESMESLYDRISKGTISVNEITEAMIRSTSEGGKYFGAMAAQSETFEGRLSTLKDTANESIGNVLAPLLQKAADEWLPAMTDAISRVDEGFTKFSDWINENQGILTGLAVVIGVITTALSLQAVVQGVKAAMNAAEATSLGALVAVKLADAAATLAALAPYLLIAAAIAAVIAVVVLLVKHWDEVKAKVAEVAAIVAAKWEEIKAKITEVITSVVAVVVSKFNEIKSTIQSALNTVKTTVTNAFNAIKTSITEALQQAKASVQQIWAEIKGVFSDAVSIGRKIVEDIKAGIAGAWDGFVSYIKGLFSKLSFTIPVSLGGVGGTGGNGTITKPSGASGASPIQGTHAEGLDYVPFDGYIAELHKGEMVVPARDARMLRSGKTPVGSTEVVGVLYQILDAVQDGNNRETVFRINNREFGRAVRGVMA